MVRASDHAPGRAAELHEGDDAEGALAGRAIGRAVVDLVRGRREGDGLNQDTRFGLAAGRELAQRLAKIERTPRPSPRSRTYQRGARWLEPRRVAQVAFTTWAADNRPRHPSFGGLREDEPAKDLKLERAKGKAYLVLSAPDAAVA